MSRFFGPILTAILLDRIGRKAVILACSFSILISWLMMSFASSIEVIFCARLLFGVTLGVNEVTSGIYVAENCTPKMRGVLCSILSFCYSIAHTIEFVLAAYVSFATAAAVNAVLAFGALLTGYFLKETPYYLVMKGRTEEAKKNLLWLRGRTNDMDDDTKFEINQIKQNMQLEVLKKRSLISIVGSPENYKPLLIITTFSFLVPGTGVVTIMPYWTLILQPSSIFSVKEFTIIIGVFQLISSCISPFIIEKFNRRTLLLNCMCSVGICQASLFILYRIKMSISHECFSWILFTGLTSSMFIFTLSYSAIIVLRSELLPMSVRAVGGSLNIMTSSIGGSLFSRLFLPVTDTIGVEYNFLCYFINCILQCILILTVLPETRGKTLVDIQMSFEPTKRKTCNLS